VDESTFGGSDRGSDSASDSSDSDGYGVAPTSDPGGDSDSEHNLYPVRDASVRGACPMPRYYLLPRDDTLDTAQRRRSVFNPESLRGSFGNPSIVEMWGNRRQRRFYNSGRTPQERLQAM
jgi:hypothetical protein